MKKTSHCICIRITPEPLYQQPAVIAMLLLVSTKYSWPSTTSSSVRLVSVVNCHKFFEKTWSGREQRGDPCLDTPQR